jgi:hypothetical protein
MQKDIQDQEIKKTFTSIRISSNDKRIIIKIIIKYYVN